jgi:molybdopterin/thiamine biosynthesis adenylyltransferase
MTNFYLHEMLYRGRDAIDKLAQTRIVLCGAGALGSLLADNLVRQGAQLLTVIDDDRIEAHNVGTQLYGKSDAGAYKVEVLRAHCFRAASVEIETIAKRLDERTVAKCLRGARLVVDTFDNSASRRVVTEYCAAQRLPCLHLGMNEDFGQVHWNEHYRVPGDVVAANVCEYPLARNLILLTVAAGAEAILRYLMAGRPENYTLTLKDLQINREED